MDVLVYTLFLKILHLGANRNWEEHEAIRTAIQAGYRTFDCAQRMNIYQICDMALAEVDPRKCIKPSASQV